MATPAEYRQFANECIHSARTATSEPVRKQFLELAKLWMTAAERMEASSSSSNAEKGDGKAGNGDGYAMPPGSTLEPQ